MRHIGVFIVDKREVVRHGLRQILKSDDYIDVVGDCANAEEALPQIRNLCPDVVLMDIQMPGLDGIEATRLLKREGKCDADVIILAERTDYLLEAMEAGAAGYLLKDMRCAELVWAIKQVYWNEHPREEREAIVELVMPPPADAARTLRFINELQERLDAGILQTVGCRDSGTLITILLKPDVLSNLLDELRDMPDVEKVEEEPLTLFNSPRKLRNLRGLRTIRGRMLVTLKDWHSQATLDSGKPALKQKTNL